MGKDPSRSAPAPPDDEPTDAPDDVREPAAKLHWSKERVGLHSEARDFYRERSHAPGVAEGGGARSHYCMECGGLLPLNYDRRQAASGDPGTCPHCGVTLDARIRRMFNWVETDQVPASDLKALLPWFLVGTLITIGLLILLFLIL